MKKEKEMERRAEEVIYSPADGKILPLSLVEDEVFSAGILGDGVGVVPKTGEIFAPCDGVVDAIFDSRHAVSMTSDFGAELLIHCGNDTVELKGEGFQLAIAQGCHVKRGELLLRFDPNLLKERGYYTTTPVIVVNADSYVVEKAESGAVRVGEPLMRLLHKKEGAR